MAKISFADLLGGSISRINSNFNLIKNALNERILWRDNPTGEPNQMFTSLDMNTNRLLNLPTPVSDTEPVRKKDLLNLGAVVVGPPGPPDTTTRTQLASSIGGSLVSTIALGFGAVLRTFQDKFREIPSITDYGAIPGGFDCYDAINLALLSNNTVYVPPGVFYTSAGSSGKPPHKITGKTLVGQSREASIIQATGTNTGRTLFVNDVTDVYNPGIWGRGRGFTLKHLGVRGNWDGFTGLVSVTENGRTGTVGLTKIQYDAANNTALIKVVSGAYMTITDCYIDNAWEHNLLMYRTGYTEISSNIFARARGSNVWLTADSPSAAITSTVVSRNQMVASFGQYGALNTKYTYGCTFTHNLPLEDNARGATFGEGADVNISFNYFEANALGDADIDPTIWGLSLLNNYWTIPPALPPVGGFATRGYFGYDRKSGLRHVPVGGLGETDNQLGPIRYSCDSQVVGIGYTAPAASGVGLTFPTNQVPSTDPATFDDYCERGFNPLDGSGASLAFITAASYTKLGRMITVSGTISVPTTTSTAVFTIAGFRLSNDQVHTGTVTDNAGLGPNTLYMPAGSDRIYIFPAGTFNTRTNVNFSGKVIHFTISYQAAF